MSKDFIFIRLMDTKQNKDFLMEEEEMVGKSYGKLLKRISVNWYYKYLIKKLPMKLGELTFLGDSIPCVMLPFTKEEKESLPNQYLDQYIEAIMRKMNINRAYCMEELQKRDNERSERERTLIKFLYLARLVNIVRDRLHIEEKDMKLVVIDSKDKRIEHVLEQFISNLNYLTIITNREEYFTGFRDMIYDTTGLVVECEELPLKSHIEGNIIIDLDSESYKNYNFFPYGACVIDVNSSSKKRQYLQERRKDLTIIYDVDLLYQGNIIKKDMMVNYLRAKSVNIEAIYGEYYRNINQNEILALIEECKIAIKEIVI
jgi:CBS domain-containing protein